MVHQGKDTRNVPFSSTEYSSHSLTGGYGELGLLRKLQGKANASFSHSWNQALNSMAATENRTQIILLSKERLLNISIWSRKPSPVLGCCLQGAVIGLFVSEVRLQMPKFAVIM